MDDNTANKFAKALTLNFAYGEQRSAAAPRPAKCRCHYTLRGFFFKKIE
jgi:hypothetical protein